MIASQIDFLEAKTITILGLILEKESKASLEDITKILSKYRGNTPVYIYDRKKGQKFKTDSRYWIQKNEFVLQELELLLGNKNVILKNKKN